MSGDAYCVECGADHGRAFDPPIMCAACEVAAGYEARIARDYVRRDDVAALEAALAVARRPHPPEVTHYVRNLDNPDPVCGALWEPTDRETIRVAVSHVMVQVDCPACRETTAWKADASLIDDRGAPCPG